MLAVWDQRYEPVADNLALSALVAALPVIVLLGLLGLLRVRAHYAALAGLATALLVAMLVYGMPAADGDGGLVNGAPFGLFPIGWIVLTAIFVYDITVETGQFEVVKHSIAGLAVRPAHPGPADRVLFRRLHRGRGRVRHPGRDLRGHADRARLPAACPRPGCR